MAAPVTGRHVIPEPRPSSAMVDAVMVRGPDGQPRIYVELALSPEVTAIVMERPELRHHNVQAMMAHAARRLFQLIDAAQPSYQQMKESSDGS